MVVNVTNDQRFGDEVRVSGGEKTTWSA